jgi:hypothetical protein
MFHCCAAVVLVSQLAVAGEGPKAEPSAPLDLRRGIPADAFVAVHGKHNPERDFQRQYYKDVWKTVQETQILEKAVEIVTDAMPEADVEKAKSVLNELAEASAPIDGEAILNASELAYGQVQQVPSAHHLFLIRLTPEAAAGCEEGVKNLMRLVEKYSEGKLPVETAEEGEATLTTLNVPSDMALRPTVARLDDVLLLSTSEELARRSLGMLAGGQGESKFDDPRLKEALSRLPEPEDALVFYDAKLQFSTMRGLGDFIREQAAADPNMERAGERFAKLIELVFDEMAVLDYEVTVEYTEGNQNRTAVYGKVLPGAQRKLLAKVFGSNKPFTEWQTWVPAEALAYSLNTGANLHPAYERIIAVAKEHFPEVKPHLERFEQLQEKHDIHLDRDILQAFSGETVSVSLPAATPSVLGGQDSVLALRCHKPDRIRELLHRLFDHLRESPFFEAQQLQLTECDDPEGFERVTALLLNLFGAQPVISFRDGWMYIGSNAPAVRKVLDTRAGEGKTITETDAFQQLNMEIEGPVQAVSYTNLAESTRQMARLIGQVGLVAPIIIGMAGKEADAEELKPVQQILGLLPSVAKIVAKFDFLEAKLSVTQDGDEPGTYVRRTVTVVRPPGEPTAPSEP